MPFKCLSKVIKKDQKASVLNKERAGDKEIKADIHAIFEVQKKVVF